ncbi:MAG: hypothetical protein NT129_02450 [Candidatus Aenigmarchaeota archaeon]|nr:hypothetical protein [Candidatus Aenigmarchaeota archaeon]
MATNQELEFVRISLCEELGAIDNYQQRIDTARDEALKKVLKHNMDEEKEHVAMLVEWLKKNDSVQNRVFEEHD